MNIEEKVMQICLKFHYDDNLKSALLQVVPLMIQKYADAQDEVISFFENIPIFYLDTYTPQRVTEITHQMTQNINLHVEEKETLEEAEYGDSCYCYQPVYDEEMNVIDEIHWIVVKAFSDSYKQEERQNFFHTTIHIPYFLHELDHAFAMKDAYYEKRGNQIYQKHGFFEEVVSFQKQEDKYVITPVSSQGRILEEIFAEKSAQDMICSYLNVTDYQKAQEILSPLGIYSNSYNSMLITCGIKLEEVLGASLIFQYRQKNDPTFVKQFNEMSQKGKIWQTYFSDTLPFDALSYYAEELFALGLESYKMSLSEYQQKSIQIFCNLLGPIFSYQEVMGTYSFDEYEHLRSLYFQESFKR